MSLYNFAKNKAKNLITSVTRQSNPEVNTGSGSAVQNLIITPFSLAFAAAMQEVDSLARLNLGNYANISQVDMDTLASNLLIQRPQGSPSLVTVRVYVNSTENFSLDTYPYFRTQGGISFRPVSRRNIIASDYLERDGEIYLPVQCISTSIGADTFIDEGEISIARDFPIAVRYVVNPASSTVSTGIPNNTDFFTYIQDKISSGTLNEIGGVKSYIRDNYPNIKETFVVPAGNPLMKRDEVWTSDGINPNLDREGLPFAASTSLGTLNFDTIYGHAYSAVGSFLENMEGSRVAISGDSENYRKIIKYISANDVIISGHPLSGTATANLLGEGPHIMNMADVYVYVPNVEIQSVLIDKRYFLTVEGDQSGVLTKVYYDVAAGFSYSSIPATGKLVALEGTEGEMTFDVTGRGVDGLGTFLSIDNSENISLTDLDGMSLYDMSSILVGSDIEESPVLYVVSVDRLDPLSFEYIETISETSPGNYSQPGWYISSPEPSQIFSPRETKSIVLDTKADVPAYAPVSITDATVKSTSLLKSGTTETTYPFNEITKSGYDFSGLEGREVSVSYPARNLDTVEVTGDIIDGAGAAVITVENVNSKWLSSIGYRDDLRVTIYDSGASVLETLEPGEARVYGNKVSKKSGALFSASADNAKITYPQILDALPTTPSADDMVSINNILYVYDGFGWTEPTVDSGAQLPAFSVETIVGSVSPSNTARLILDDPLVSVCVVDDPSSISVAVEYSNLSNVNFSAPDLTGSFNVSPVRVTYATHSDIASLQTVLDGADAQLLCKDTLCRSFLPSIIDAEIRYRGSSSAEDIYKRFLALLQQSVKETNDGTNIRIDMSNIIAALDDEGLLDATDPNFQIKVSSYLDDGEFEVRYINPSLRVKQNMAIFSASTAGDREIVVKRLRGNTTPQGRGLVKLGGNNPAAQELIPYEAIIDNGDETYRLVLRSATLYNHPQWEGAIVSVRDYDEELEYQDGTIYIPSNNRPYIRNLVITRQA